MYSLDSKSYDDLSLAWYKTSGKFDKNSYGRWIEEKYKTRLIRASIDNSFAYLPANISSDAITEDLIGHLLIIACDNVIKSVGIIVQHIKSPDNFLDCSKLLIVHILSTSNVSLNIPIQFVQEDYLPMRVMKICEYVSDRIDIGVENLGFTREYEQHILCAHAYGNFLDFIMTFETPVKSLEIERKKRILAIFKVLRCSNKFLLLLGSTSIYMVAMSLEKFLNPSILMNLSNP
jgi:hypothetical protein